MQEQSNFDPSIMTGGTVWALGKEDPSSLLRKLLLWWEVHDKWEISLNYFAGNYWQNVNGLWDRCLQLVLKPYCLVEKWQEDACSKSCSKNHLPCFSLMKKQSAEQIVPLSDMPVHYFTDPVMKGDKPESLQTKMSEEGQKSSSLISSRSNTRQKKSSIGGLSNSAQNLKQDVLI